MKNLLVGKILAILAVAVMAPSFAQARDSGVEGPAVLLQVEAEEINEILSALEAFWDDPIAAYKVGHVAKIMDFAEASDAVLIEISEKVVDFEVIAQGGNESISPFFLAAFVAGNMDYQLRHKLVEDRPVEGAEWMLRTYRQMLEAGYIRNIEKFDRWALAAKKGRLADAIDAETAVD